MQSWTVAESAPTVELDTQRDETQLLCLLLRCLSMKVAMPTPNTIKALSVKTGRGQNDVSLKIWMKHATFVTWHQTWAVCRLASCKVAINSKMLLKDGCDVLVLFPEQPPHCALWRCLLFFPNRIIVFWSMFLCTSSVVWGSSQYSAVLCILVSCTLWPTISWYQCWQQLVYIRLSRSWCLH